MYYQSFALTGNLPGREVPGGQGIRMPGRDGRTFCLSPQVHTLFLGATGFGKTTALLRMVPALRQEVTRRGGVLFFFDPKEDFIAALARPGDVILGRTHFWNLPAEVMEGFGPHTGFQPVFERAMEISGQLFAERMKPGAAGEQYFPKAARSVLAGLLTAQAMDGLSDPALARGLNNAVLLDEVNRATPQRLLTRLAPYPQLESIRYHLYTDGEGRLNNESNGVLSELTLAVREMLEGSWGQAGDFSVRRFLRQGEGRALFLAYDSSLGTTQGACCRAVTDLALQESLSPALKQREKVFFLEELPLLSHPPLENLSNALNLGRGLGVRVICAAQSVSQLYHLYGQHQADALLGGFGQKLFFRPNDARGAEYLQRQLGQAQRMEYTFNSRGERVASPRLGQALESWEIARMGVGDAYVSLNGPARPFFFQFAP